MPNIDAPFGLRPVRRRNGGTAQVAATPYYIPASYGTALFIGDPVVKTGTSNTANVTAPGVGSFSPGMMAEINKATVGSGNPITGVIIGFAASPTNLGLIYNPASTERIAFVADDPDLEFEIQADGAIAAVDIGLNANLIYTNAGSTVTGLSGAELNSATEATTAAFQMKIIGTADNPDRADLGSDWTVVRVRINNHTEAHATAGI
jgi:hypothetical protein